MSIPTDGTRVPWYSSTMVLEYQWYVRTYQWYVHVYVHVYVPHWYHGTYHFVSGTYYVRTYSSTRVHVCTMVHVYWYVYHGTFFSWSTRVRTGMVPNGTGAVNPVQNMPCGDVTDSHRSGGYGNTYQVYVYL